MKISLCMIVKNESNSLINCLQNVKSYVDEIIVVDTGSTDNTKEIALRYTTQIYDFSWCDDFSKARNYSISKASNDWIMVLDADEEIENFDRDSITKFTIDKCNEKVIGRINIKNLLEENNLQKISNERVSRFFNRKYYHYEGIIHEQLCCKKGEYNSKNIKITVKHTGYMKEVLKRKNKIERNINLIKKAIKINNKDSYLYYQLGKTYYLNKQYEEACSNFRKAINYENNLRLEYVEDLVETFGYSLINTKRYEEALKIKEFDIHYDNSADYNFLMGLIYMNNAKFSLAVNTFLKCIGCKTGKRQGVNSYLPNYNIGVVFECLGYKEEAYSYYSKCMDYKPAIERIANIIK